MCSLKMVELGILPEMYEFRCKDLLASHNTNRLRKGFCFAAQWSSFGKEHKESWTEFNFRKIKCDWYEVKPSNKQFYNA